MQLNEKIGTILPSYRQEKKEESLVGMSDKVREIHKRAIQIKDRENKEEFYVALKVEGRYIARVFAKDKDEAKALAFDAYTEADFGDLEDIDAEFVVTQDSHGNYVDEC